MNGSLTVNKANTSLSVKVYKSGSSGQSLLLTATAVAIAPGAGTPTGSVTFMDGATTLGTVQLNNASASLSISTGPEETHAFTASYSGSNNFEPSSTTGEVSEWEKLYLPYLGREASSN